MMKIQKNMKIIGLCSAATMIAAPSCFAANLITSGNINVATNWDTGALPGTGEIGTVAIDAAWPNASAAGTLAITGDLVIGSTTATNINLTAATDIVGVNPSSVTFDNVTATVGDDIFTGGAAGNFIFNSGSVTNVDDDFEANGGGTITVNGGTHAIGLAPTGTANFGAQNNSTLNFLGGTVTGVDLFRATTGASLTIGGDATLTGDAGSSVSFVPGTVDIDSGWTGSLNIPGTDWVDVFTTAGVTLDGNAINPDDFILSDGGDTIALAIPEPSSAALLGLAGLALLGRRRK